MIQVHLAYPPAPEDLAVLRGQLHPNVQLTIGELPDPAQYEILVNGRPTPQELSASPNLHTVIIPWAGLPEVTAERLKQFPHLKLHNLHHNAAVVAEGMLMLLLSVARLAVPADRALRKGDWRPRYERPFPAQLLHGKTALILGYGAIGQRLAQLCRALGMNVHAIRRRIEKPITDNSIMGNAITVHPADSLLTLLPQANVLLICLPHTPKTDGLLGEGELALLPPKAILVNAGRAAIVDEDALYEALVSGHLHGAGLDVWYRYPKDEAARANTFPGERPFHQLDNVLLSPHRTGHVAETESLRLAALAELLNAAAEGKPLPNKIDITRGY
ncbi:NAD(P)-dependent oxidoreductase [Candidatus Leptofilum sp.]|uniref:NAD(P)-dependent oxidoreductase n=1 Tax=Candidatus Leptofilum sp. TaxID=3241576 RepID=UPI003B5AAEEE